MVTNVCGHHTFLFDGARSIGKLGENHHRDRSEWVGVYEYFRRCVNKGIMANEMR